MLRLKGMAKKTKKKTTKKAPGSERLKNVNHEVFARLYGGKNSQFFGNAKQCYLLAYGYRDRLDEAEAKRNNAKYGSPDYNEAKNEIRKIQTTCESNGSTLLRNPKVEARINFLLEEMAEDLELDRERAFVARQRVDLNSKIRAIESFDKIKNRVNNNPILEGKLEITWAKDESDLED